MSISIPLGILDVLNRPKIRKKYHLTKKKIKDVKKSLEKDCKLVKPRQKLKIVPDNVEPADYSKWMSIYGGRWKFDQLPPPIF